MDISYKSPYGNDENTEKMDYTHTEAYQMTYDLSVYLHKKVMTFPKYEKFTLQLDIRRGIDDVMDEIAVFEKTKVPSHIYAADRHKSRLVRKIRLAYDLGYINDKSYKYIAEQLGYIGSRIGGLINKVRKNKG